MQQWGGGLWAGVTSSFRLFISWAVLIMNIVFRSPESLGGLQGIRVKGEGVKFHTREPGRCLSIAAAVAGGAIVLALLLAPFSLASTDPGIRGGGETSWCCCGCPPDRGAGRKCCCVPAGNGDPVAATDLPSSACDCSLGASRDTDSAEFTVVPARKYPLPPGEFAFAVPSSAPSVPSGPFRAGLRRPFRGTARPSAGTQHPLLTTT